MPCSLAASTSAAWRRITLVDGTKRAATSPTSIAASAPLASRSGSVPARRFRYLNCPEPNPLVANHILRVSGKLERARSIESSQSRCEGFKWAIGFVADFTGPYHGQAGERRDNRHVVEDARALRERK